MAGSTVNMGTTQGSTYDITYSGDTVAINIKADGYYKLECWGAGGGGGDRTTGGAGGYSCGYKLLSSGETIYARAGKGGGYKSGYCFSGDGGESTHFARVDGTIANIGASNKSQILIVAGGGGGGSTGSTYNGAGGAGGGETGGNETTNGYSNGATQSSGYAFGTGQPKRTDGGDGYVAGGGGGGLYGGKNGHKDSGYTKRGGGGGSGYVGGVPSITYNGTTLAPTNTQGGHTGSGGPVETGGDKTTSGTNGKAKITLSYLAKIPVYYTPSGGSQTQLDKLYFNNTECTSCYLNNTKVY